MAYRKRAKRRCLHVGAYRRMDRACCSPLHLWAADGVPGLPIMTRALVTDPVCWMEFPQEAAAAASTYLGRTYYFCDPFCQKLFAHAPNRFLKALAKASRSKVQIGAGVGTIAIGPGATGAPFLVGHADRRNLKE